MNQELKRRHRITEILMEIGVAPSYRGFDYLRDNIAMYMAMPNRERMHWVGELRKRIAVMYGATEYKVERCERHAMRRAMDNCSPHVQEKYFRNCIGWDKGYPALREFIAMVAKYVEMEEEENGEN